MTFTIKPALRTSSRLFLGLCGPSGCGKTKSALELATGIVGQNGAIVGIDTENERMLEYAPPPGIADDELKKGLAEGRWYRFEHLPLNDPYSPARYKEAIGEAVKYGAQVIIVDSTSHMHEGPGGVLAMHAADLDRMAGDDYKKRERVNAAAWIRPKAEFHDFLYFALRQKCHFIFCFRARKKVGLAKATRNGREVTEFVDRGFVPISTEGFEFEMTARLMLPPGAKGVPTDDPEFTKINDPVKHIFKSGEALSRKTGIALRQWAEVQPPARELPKTEPKAESEVVSDRAEHGSADKATPAATDTAPRADVPKFEIIRGKDKIAACASADEWRDRMVAGVGQLGDESLEILLNLNAGRMAQYERGYPEHVQTVREKFIERIGRDR